MDERLRFVARLLEGEAMAAVCREFGISRKTGYRIFDRYKEHGLEALSDRSRRPVRYANQLPAQIESLIVAFKREKPHWGARKLRELLVRRLPGDVRVPAKSTIHAVLYRHGLVRVPGRPRRRATGTPLSPGLAPNDLWCADFKGEFKLGNAVRNFVRGGRLNDQAMALVKRSPKRTANWALAMAPLARRHDPLLLGAVQDQEEELRRGLVAGEMASGPDRPAQLGIQAPRWHSWCTRSAGHRRGRHRTG